MALELDHVLLFTSPGAPVVDRLIAEGFCEGSPNEHPGQGTANRRVFFVDAYLEFLFPTDRNILASPDIAPTGLLPRFDRGCPLGLALRANLPDDNLPFPTWEFRPPYLPSGTRILMATSSEVAEEPLIAVVPFGRRPDSMPVDQRQPLRHPAGPQSIRGIRLVGPWRAPQSPAMAAVAAMTAITVASGTDYHAEVTLGPGPGNHIVELRPDVPVSLSW